MAARTAPNLTTESLACLLTLLLTGLSVGFIFHSNGILLGQRGSLREHKFCERQRHASDSELINTLSTLGFVVSALAIAITVDFRGTTLISSDKLLVNLMTRMFFYPGMYALEALHCPAR